MSDINAKLAKILGLPENTTRADIRIRPMQAPEIDLTYFVIDESGIPDELECRFMLTEISEEE